METRTIVRRHSVVVGIPMQRNMIDKKFTHETAVAAGLLHTFVEMGLRYIVLDAESRGLQVYGEPAMHFSETHADFFIRNALAAIFEVRVLSEVGD